MIIKASIQNFYQNPTIKTKSITMNYINNNNGLYKENNLETKNVENNVKNNN